MILILTSKYKIFILLRTLRIRRQNSCTHTFWLYTVRSGYILIACTSERYKIKKKQQLFFKIWLWNDLWGSGSGDIGSIEYSFITLASKVSMKIWSYPTRRQLYGHLLPITKTIQARRIRHAGHWWRSKDEIVSDVLLWTPAYGQSKAGRPARTFIQQLCDTIYQPLLSGRIWHKVNF